MPERAARLSGGAVDAALSLVLVRWCDAGIWIVRWRGAARTGERRGGGRSRSAIANPISHPSERSREIASPEKVTSNMHTYRISLVSD
eukprot:79219-Prymnesium_polylepis.2